jgi:hypothetical protein
MSSSPLKKSMEWGSSMDFETAVLAKCVCSETVGALDILGPVEANRTLRSRGPTFQFQ